MSIFRRKGQSPALSSSNTPAQVTGSLSDDVASFKGKFNKLWHRDGRGHTDTTGDVAATSSNSESPVSMPNAQTTATKDSNNFADSSSGNKTANVAVILDIVQDICEVLDNVPYVKVVAGVLSTAMKIVDEVDACRGEWDQVKVALLKVRDTVFKFRHGRDDSAPLPDDVKAAFRELESCLREVLDAVTRYEAVSKGRLTLQRGTLKADATSCVGRIDMAVKVFQMTIHVDTRLAVEQTRLTGEQTYLAVERTHHGVEKILATIQQGPTPTPSSSLNLNVLACPAPSQYFTGRESILWTLSRMFTMPVVTLFSMNSNALSAFVHSFDHLSRFTVIFLDVSSVEALKAIVHNIRANDSAHSSPLLVLENADASLKLDQYLPYSLHNPILVTSTNQAVSRFASPGCEFELPDSADWQAADGLRWSIEMAFVPLLHVVTIVAKGGTGKTQVVLRYVSENPSRFLHVWFFDATSDATLATDFKKLGNAASIGESVDDVRKFLERMHKDWLLIFDNADDPKVDLSKYIPQCDHGNVIITSCLTEVHQMASPDSHLDFSDLEQSEAVDLLLKHAHKNSDNDNQQLASDIVDELGCQALAVATAGAYIASTATCTLSNYLSLFKQKCKQLLNYKMKSLDGYQKTVFSAFQLSFDQLSSSTKLFMQICAFFHHTAIPVELFYRAAAFTGDDIQPGEEKTPAVEELKHFLSLFTHNRSWNDTIDELSCLSLTMYDSGAKALSFHSVLHMCVQETIIDKERFQRLLVAHADCLWIKVENIRQKTLVYCESYFGRHHLNTLRSKSNLAQIYKELGQVEEAKVLEKETLKLCKEVLGECHSDTLRSMSGLAITYEMLGQLEEAEVLQKETLKLCKEVLGECHPDTLRSMSNLAIIYEMLGQLEKAEVLKKETLKLRKEVLGECHPDTLTSMNNLAITYEKLGQLEKAEVLEKETLKLRKEVLGECHPDTLTSMNNLAITYEKLGQLEKAEVLKKETLKLRKEVLGERHPDTLTSMNNLAIIYEILGQLEEAEVLKKETLKLHKEVLGERHPDTLKSMNNLAITYEILGQLKKAEVLKKETLKLRKEVLGEHHPDTLTSMNNLAITYEKLGQLKKAEVLEKETLKLRKEVLGECHPDTLTSMSNLAITYEKLGQLKKAEVLEKETLKLRKEVLGERHPDTLASMNNLAITYEKLGQRKKAKVLQKETLKLHKEVLGEHHPDTLRSMSNLAITYEKLGQLKKTEMLEKETLKLRKEVLGECHPDTLTSMSNLAITYEKLGQLKETEVLEKETLKLRKEVLGERHPDTLTSMSNLAITYEKLGQLKKTEVLEKETLKLRKEVLGERHPDTLTSMSNLAITYEKLGQRKKAKVLKKETLKLLV
ncbi:uncharacterized protein ARMOST_11552 [Armillaria ostoyae]|uniref:Uncharacterized protein n=1 Tax=Armillaria ostoyae TaxID=47428 RepID=A0A284RHF6_ARMOS|nr:uncharacterized protein ARMOST_11552 [Armillaria ostoyae]